MKSASLLALLVVLTFDSAVIKAAKLRKYWLIDWDILYCIVLYCIVFLPQCYKALEMCDKCIYLTALFVAAAIQIRIFQYSHRIQDIPLPASFGVSISVLMSN